MGRVGYVLLLCRRACGCGVSVIARFWWGQLSNYFRSLGHCKNNKQTISRDLWGPYFCWGWFRFRPKTQLINHLRLCHCSVSRHRLLFGALTPIPIYIYKCIGKVLSTDAYIEDWTMIFAVECFYLQFGGGRGRLAHMPVPFPRTVFIAVPTFSIFFWILLGWW